MRFGSLVVTATILAATASAELFSMASVEAADDEDSVKSVFMKSTKTGESSKKGKTSKSAGSGGEEPPGSCTSDEFLVARFGPQLCQSEIDEKFTKLESTDVTASGIQNFRSPGFSVPLVDSFGTGNGWLDMTFEQAQSVCVTMCENNPYCTEVFIRPVSNDNPGIKTPYLCRMWNSGLGPGAYQIEEPDGYRAPDSNTVVYTKVGSPQLPPFEPCDMSFLDIPTGVGCLFEQIQDPAICDPILTEDWMQYLSPAMFCLVAAGESVLNDCLTCLTTSGGLDIEMTCLTDPQNSLIRGVCGDVCYNNGVQGCEESIQTAVLCVTGGPLARSGDITSGGFINGPDYVCPTE